MKKIVFILLVTILVATGCSKGAEIVAGQDQNIEKVDEMLTDFEAIKEFLINDDNFSSGYLELQGEPLNFDNYKLHHIDFNHDGKLDTVINTWSKESDYRVLIFVTLQGSNYQYYISNLRASHDSTFDVEDEFIIVENHGYRNIAYLLDNSDTPIIRSTFENYKIPETIEVSSEYNADMNFKTVYSLKKNDGLKEFEEETKRFYYDENGQEHLVNHMIWHKKFNAETMEYENTKNTIVEDITSATISENLIIGTNNNLKTFKNVLDENNNFKAAIDYYYENRREFSEKTRITYINDILEYINSFTNYNNDTFVIENNVETVLDVNIANVNIWGDNPVPENARNLFKLAKYFYIENGEELDKDIHLEEGYYRITCVNNVYANKIRGLKFDKLLLEDNYDGSFSKDDEYIDVIFENREQVTEDVEDIVYPTILIKNLSQLNEFKNSTLWKANIVIVPEKVTFIPYASDDYTPETLGMFENETLYSEDQELDIDYTNYNLVVIPQQISINEQSLTLREINITETGSETTQSFIVLGILEDVKLKYISNTLDPKAEIIEKYIGTVSNEKVIIKASMPTDNSSIIVEGQWFYDMGDFEQIQFSLDDARDPQSYPLILKKINE